METAVVLCTIPLSFPWNASLVSTTRMHYGYLLVKFLQILGSMILYRDADTDVDVCIVNLLKSFIRQSFMSTHVLCQVCFDIKKLTLNFEYHLFAVV